MDKINLEEARKENEAHLMAIDMMLSMLEFIAPDDMQPIVQLPKLCNAIDKKKNLILRLVSDDFENGVRLASEANELLSRVDEALGAFIEQHTEGGIHE